MNSIVPGWNRDHKKHRDVIVMGKATDPNTQSVFVVVETEAGLELFRPFEFEEPSRFKRNDEILETPRFTPIAAKE